MNAWAVVVVFVLVVIHERWPVMLKKAAMIRADERSAVGWEVAAFMEKR